MKRVLKIAGMPLRLAAQGGNVDNISTQIIHGLGTV